MSFRAIDAGLDEWARSKGAQVYRRYQDYEVRVLELADDRGDLYRITVGQPHADGVVELSIWDLRTNIKTFVGTIEELTKLLDEAYAQICDWISIKGRIRSIV
jgi:hypothetical protein